MKRMTALLTALLLLMMTAAYAQTAGRSIVRGIAEDEALANAAIAADSIYDTTLSDGDVFSFNAAVGPRTEDYGYVQATNGRGVRVVGGGVAAVASAIWLAVRDMDDISVVERTTYGKDFSGGYVSSGSDAIMVDYRAGHDFRFRYTGEGTITIYTWTDDGCVYCEITQEDD